jgi:hypothetical protein
MSDPNDPIVPVYPQGGTAAVSSTTPASHGSGRPEVDDLLHYILHKVLGIVELPKCSKSFQEMDT